MTLLFWIVFMIMARLKADCKQLLITREQDQHVVSVLSWPSGRYDDTFNALTKVKRRAYCPALRLLATSARTLLVEDSTARLIRRCSSTNRGASRSSSHTGKYLCSGSPDST